MTRRSVAASWRAARWLRRRPASAPASTVVVSSSSTSRVLRIDQSGARINAAVYAVIANHLAVAG
ncbi:MAG: hypothetical protein ACLQCU_00975, partial [Acidimicrobiales bacterium]